MPGVNIKRLDEARTMLFHDDYQKIFGLIKKMQIEDLEYSTLGFTQSFHLLDWAIAQRKLDVANAIINRYAELSEKPISSVKPLSIDYDEMDANTTMYNLNLLKCLDFNYIQQYKWLVEEQKLTYLNEIKDESKKLRIMGIEQLLEITTEPGIKATLMSSLGRYKESSLDTYGLDAAIQAAFGSVREADKDSITYKKAVASINTANKVDMRCHTFATENHYAHSKLTVFKADIANILNHSSNDVLKKSRGSREALASIGNIVARYTGVGYAIAATQGKFKEFHEFKWTLFNEKTKSEDQKDSILNQTQTRLGG